MSGKAYNNFLLKKLEKLNYVVYRRFMLANNYRLNEFTFIFPEEFWFQKSSFEVIGYQLQIFLDKHCYSYHTKFNIKEYYEKLFNLKGKIRIILDLSKTYYIGDLEILMLIVLGRFCYKISKLEVLVKFNPEKIDILKRWNFFEHFWEWGEPYPKLSETYFAPQRWMSDVLIPIREIAEYDDVTNTIDSFWVKKIIDMLKRDYDMDEEIIDTFVTDVISEICNNIYQHSHDIGFILVHAHRQQTKKDIPNIEIAISDCGIGIKQSLQNRFPLVYANKKHHEIIVEVLDGNFPYPEDEAHGGILRARKFADNFGGHIFIRSICAKGGNKGFFTDKDSFWGFFPGTHVNILIPRRKLKK